MKNKVLIIEDDADILAILQLALQKNYLVECVSNCLEVEPSLKRLQPDLIMIDNNVGQYKAADIVSVINKTKGAERIPLILFTADIRIEKIAKEINAAAYLSKPFELAALYACIENVLEKKIALVT